jgi:hypothetical protein
MPCDNLCVREQVSADPGVSHGPVAGGEELCRGAYDPMHFKKAKLKNSFIKSKDLLNGHLSVWRLGDPAGLGIQEIANILGDFSPAENRLGEIKTCTAEAIRGLTIFGHDGRVFSVIDNCEAYADGRKHRSHAVVAICRELNPQQMMAESPIFEEIRNKIYLAFEATTKWVAKS